VRQAIRQLHRSAPAQSLMISQHRDTEYNNKDTPFEFTAENQKKVLDILSRYPSNYKAVRFLNLIQLANVISLDSISSFLPLVAGCHVASARFGAAPEQQLGPVVCDEQDC
jgi:hypothetical protein